MSLRKMFFVFFRRSFNSLSSSKLTISTISINNMSLLRVHKIIFGLLFLTFIKVNQVSGKDYTKIHKNMCNVCIQFNHETN